MKRDKFISTKDESILPDRGKFYLPYTIDDKQTDLYYLKSGHNMYAAITNYGARLVSLIVPDSNNALIDVIIGPGSVEEFRSSKEPYFGATIGRFGNRIANGKFKIDDIEYTLSRNENGNTLHGGNKGFQHVVWDALQLDDATLNLKYLSKDNEEGFPGNLNVNVKYTLTDNNDLRIDYEAFCDKKTIINLTNHSFFNLNGQGQSRILSHLMQINADYYTPVDSSLIPIGSIESVNGTAFDFREIRPIYDNMTKLKLNGFDHNFVLNRDSSGGLTFAVKLIGPISGIQMDIFTEEPCLLFYSGAGMKGENLLKNGQMDYPSTALVLETHQFPDAPNQKVFPKSILEPDGLFRTTSVYSFKVNHGL